MSFCISNKFIAPPVSHWFQTLGLPKQMSKQIILRNIKEAENHIEDLRISAEESQIRLDEISSYSDPIEFLRKLKFEQVGCDPLDNQRPLNFIEQLNQTFTYLASFKAAKILFERYPELKSLTLNLGTKSGSDIESIENGIAAEVFASVNPSNNKKLQKDISKVLAVEAKHKYVFFMCPEFEEGPYPNQPDSSVVVWSLGEEIMLKMP